MDNKESLRDVEIAFDNMSWIEHEYDACFDELQRKYDDPANYDPKDCDPDNWASTDLETLRNLWRRLLDAEEVCNKKRDIARGEWAQARGWRINPEKGGYSLHRDLGHYEVFEDAAGRRMGIVSHVHYASRPKIEAYAAARKLRATILEDSWYAPGFATAVLFTRATR